MAPKRRRHEVGVDAESETDHTMDSKDDNEIVEESNKAAPKTKGEKAKAKAVDVSKAQEDEVNVNVEEEEDKPIINRIWSFSDEIGVLQALIDFNEDNYKSQEDFYTFVKGKLDHSEFSKAQVRDKIQKLKKKYRNILKKSCGSDPQFSNPHDLKSFQLSKKIWGYLDANNNNNNNNDNNNSNAKTGGGHVKEEEEEEEDIRRVDDEKKKEMQRLYPHLIKGFEGEYLPKLVPLDVLKNYLSKVDSVVLEEWDTKWKKVRLAETHAYLTRLALIQEQTNWFYNHMAD